MPDVFQLLVKEKGVFTNVTSPSTKAKLRILFEIAPLALMVSVTSVQASQALAEGRHSVCTHVHMCTHACSRTHGHTGLRK